jgi:ketosteroid isomerase-like protein
MSASTAWTEALEDELRQAMLAADVAALDRLLDEQLLFVGPDGRVFRKAEDLEAHRRGLWRFVRLDVLERAVERGEGLVATATLAELGGVTADGASFGGRFRYARSWRLGADGQWRVAAGAVVPVAASASR